MQRIGTPMRRGVGKKLRIEDIASMFNTIRRRGKEEIRQKKLKKEKEAVFRLSGQEMVPWQDM